MELTDHTTINDPGEQTTSNLLQKKFKNLELRTFSGDSATPHLGMSASKLSAVTWVPCECHRHDTDNFNYSFYPHCSHNEPPGTKLVSPATQLLPAWGQTSEPWRQLTATRRQLYWSHSHYLCPVDRLRTSLTPTSIYWIP